MILSSEKSEQTKFGLQPFQNQYYPWAFASALIFAKIRAAPGPKKTRLATTTKDLLLRPQRDDASCA